MYSILVHQFLKIYIAIAMQWTISEPIDQTVSTISARDNDICIMAHAHTLRSSTPSPVRADIMKILSKCGQLELLPPTAVTAAVVVVVAVVPSCRPGDVSPAYMILKR